MNKTVPPAPVVRVNQKLDISDADTTPLPELGLKGDLLEKLEASQVYTAGELARWLRVRRQERIPGLGPEKIGRLSDLLVGHQIQRARSGERVSNRSSD
jgi:hypothetical protein